MPNMKPCARSQSPSAFMPEGNLLRSSTSRPSASRVGASQQSSLPGQDSGVSQPLVCRIGFIWGVVSLTG